MSEPQFPVTEAAMRPATDARACFYCKQPVGDFHKQDCVLVKRKVRLRFTVEYTAHLPAHWEDERIEQHHTGNTWCMDNIVDDLQAHIDRGEACLCEAGACKVISRDPNVFVEER